MPVFAPQWGNLDITAAEWIEQYRKTFKKAIGMYTI